MANRHTGKTEGVKRKEQEKLENLLLDGFRSGEASPLTKEDFEEIKRRGLERLKARKSK